MFGNRSPNYIFKISIIAGNDVGKKTLASYFAGQNDAGIFITQGIQLGTLDIMVSGSFIQNSLWIYSNEEEYRNLFPYYINGSNGMIMMYDITKLESLNYLSEIYRLIKIFIKGDMPVLLAGNKIDLKGERRVRIEYIEKFKEIHNISISTEISLKTGENVEKMFRAISKLMIKHFNQK